MHTIAHKVCAHNFVLNSWPDDSQYFGCNGERRSFSNAELHSLLKIKANYLLNLVSSVCQINILKIIKYLLRASLVYESMDFFFFFFWINWVNGFHHLLSNHIFTRKFTHHTLQIWTQGSKYTNFTSQSTCLVLIPDFEALTQLPLHSLIDQCTQIEMGI